MKTRLVSLASTIVILCATTSLVRADTVCLKSRLKSGKIINTAKTVAEGASCPAGFTALLSTSAYEGAQGPQGPTGATGPTGMTGVSGSSATVNISSFKLVFGETSDKGSTAEKSVFVACPVGYTTIACHGGIEEGLGVPTNDKIALSYNGTTRFGDCFFRGYETEPVATNWSVLGFALCVPDK
jgi:hypothetical protein